MFLEHSLKNHANRRSYMNTLHATVPSTLDELEESIARAMDRVKVRKESDLCHYLPGKGGRLHHFAFGKLKKTQPLELLKMIKEHILEREIPKTFSSKPKPRLRVKSQVEVKFKRSQFNRLVDILKKAGEQELISMLAPHQTLAQVQKLMLDMIKEREADQDLWETYVRLVKEERSVLQQ